MISIGIPYNNYQLMAKQNNYIHASHWKELKQLLWEDVMR